MTRFIDGPANGVTLMLKRAPLLLRVTFRKVPGSGNKVPGSGNRLPWDGLDQFEDAPTPDETIFVYQRQGAAGGAFIDGPRVSGFYTIASYVAVPAQPADVQVRDNTAWQNWCREYVKEHPLQEV